MTNEQDERIRAYMQKGATLEKAVKILPEIVAVKESDEEALAIIMLLMATTKNVIESRTAKH